jgi:Holliday junction resolvase RusA-like endonuclease
MTRALREARAVRLKSARWVAVTLPVPPSLNGQYIHTRYGTRLHPRAEAFRTEAVLRIREALAGGVWPTDARYRVTVDVWFANEKRPTDLDNCLKLVGDAAAAALGYNDRQVVEIHAYHRGYDPEAARLELGVEVLPA